MRKVNLRKTLFILPSLFTLSSIFCGFYAVLLCTDGVDPDHGVDPDTIYRGSLLIVFAMFFDMIDGRVARLTKTQSAFGVQIDSLADLVSFGVAPAVLVYQWSLRELGTWGIVVAFAFVACGAIRLARFNVLAMGVSGAPKKPSKYIVGLPIPGAAGVLVSVIVANHAVEGSVQRFAPAIATLLAVLAVFMVSSIKFRSFKDLRLNRMTFLFVTIAVGSSVALAIQFHPSFALVFLLLSYLTIGVGEGLFNLSRLLTQARRRRSAVERASHPEVEDPDELT